MRQRSVGSRRSAEERGGCLWEGGGGGGVMIDVVPSECFFFLSQRQFVAVHLNSKDDFVLDV